MTTRPRLVSINRSLLPGLAALALFVVIAAVTLSADFGDIAASFGFDAGQNIVGSIGAALVGIDPGVLGEEAAVPVESFLVALIVIAVALDAALDGAVMLAKRDDEEGAGADGGEP